MGIVPRSLDRKTQGSIQTNRIKDNIEFPGVTVIRLLNEDTKRGIVACG